MPKKEYKQKCYIITRTVKEEYLIFAKSAAEAKKKEFYDPSSVTVVRETVKLQKDEK